jgi:hypothetical protein
VEGPDPNKRKAPRPWTQKTTLPPETNELNGHANQEEGRNAEHHDNCNGHHQVNTSHDNESSLQG